MYIDGTYDNPDSILVGKTLIFVIHFCFIYKNLNRNRIQISLTHVSDHISLNYWSMPLPVHGHVSDGRCLQDQEAAVLSCPVQ